MEPPGPESLIHRYLDGLATPDELMCLSALLENDGEVRRLYLDLAGIHAALGACEELRVTTPAAPPRPTRPAAMTRPRASVPPKVVRFPIRRVLALAAVLVVTGFAVFLWQNRQPQAVATLADAREAVWTGAAPAPGSQLRPGPFRLESGTVSLVFASGARMVVEGPAEFALTTGNAASLTAGRLRAEVPPAAHGFRVNLPQVSVVDLGTVFGIATVPGAESLVKVITGSVEVRTPGGSGTLLHSGDGVAVSADGNAVPAQLHNALFPEAGTGAGQITATPPGGSSGITPRLHLDLETSPPSKRAGSPSGSNALRRQKEGDPMLVNIPEAIRQITLSARIQAEDLRNPLNTLLASDGWRAGGLHWNVTARGHLQIAVHGKKGGEVIMSETPSVITPSRPGTWVHVAATIDGRVIRHYVNGRLIHAAPFVLNTPILIRKAHLGDWHPWRPASASSARNFTGSIDDFFVFDQSLSPAAIARLHSGGMP